MDRLRSILYFTNSTLWGGVEEHICGLSRSLSPSRFRVHLVCDPQLFSRFRSAVSENVEVTPLALSHPMHIAGAIKFAKLLRCNRFDIVHSHMFWSSLFASPIAWACRVPTIVETLHGTEAWRSGWKASGALDRATTRFVSRYVAVCHSDARFLREHKHVPRPKISIIPNGVNVERFAASPAARAEIRQGLHIDEASPVLLVVARLHRGKGHRVILEAMRHLLPSFPNLKLLCLGEGEEAADLNAQCKRLGLTESVRMLGYRNNVADFLAAADINVLPTFYEGLPLTVLEAMAAGLPTIASNVGGIPDAIEDGVSGLLVPPGDPVRLAGAVSSLLNDAGARARLRHAAQLRVRQRFTFERQVTSTERMYLDLCGVTGPETTSLETSPASVPTLPATCVSSSDNDLELICAEQKRTA